MPIGDPAELTDLDALQLTGLDQVVDLVPPDVKHVGTCFTV
jgi:hypothetical protein